VFTTGGSFIQYYDLAKALPTGTTVDYETGKTVPYTHPCVILATTRPEWDLVDQSNPRTGGIQLRYGAMPDPAADNWDKCPNDPKYNIPLQRTLVLNLLCDPLLPETSLVELTFTETSSCQYEFNVSTGASCGQSGDPYAAVGSGSVPSNTAAVQAGTQFGYTLLGAVLLLAGQYAERAGVFASILGRVRGKTYAGLSAPLAGGSSSGRAPSGMQSIGSSSYGSA
jgi:hypothetical protein